MRICMYIYTYVYAQREREREREPLNFAQVIDCLVFSRRLQDAGIAENTCFSSIH